MQVHVSVHRYTRQQNHCQSSRWFAHSEQKGQRQNTGAESWALTSAGITYASRRACFLLLVQVNSMVKEGSYISICHNQGVHAQSVEQKDWCIFRCFFVFATVRGKFSLALPNLVTAHTNLLVLAHHFFLSFLVQHLWTFPYFLLKAPARFILSIGVLRRKL